MVLRYKTVWTILLISILCTACGYRFAGESSLPGDTQRLFVSVFENRSSETGVENIVTNEILSELTLRRTRNLVGSLDDAEVVLSGIVQQVVLQTISARKGQIAAQRRVTVTVDFRLTKKDGSVVWAANGISDFEPYRVDNESKDVTEKNRRDAIKVLSKRIAERTVNRFSDDF